MFAGARAEDLFGIICPGQTLTFSVKSEYAFKENTFPRDVDVIEAFSMVDLIIVPSSVDQAKLGDKGGYGIKISKVRVHASSVYSYVKDIHSMFEHTLHNQQTFILGMLNRDISYTGVLPSTEDNPNGALLLKPADTIRNCLENRAPLYVIPQQSVEPHSYVTNIRPDLDFFKVQTVHGDDNVAPGVQHIDLPIAVTLTLLNTDNETYAKTLLDFAIGAGAVSFLAVTDEWFNKNESAVSASNVDSSYADTS